MAEHNCTPDCTAGGRAGSKCHCRNCGRNFLSVGGFDSHRWHKGGADGCIDPIAVGLHQDQSGFYGTAEGIAQGEILSRQMQTVRASRGS